MLPDDLRTALDQALTRFTPQELSDSVTRLTERYRIAGVSTGGNHLRSRADIAAYAAYRMPATYAAAAWPAVARRRCAGRRGGRRPSPRASTAPPPTW